MKFVCAEYELAVFMSVTVGGVSTCLISLRLNPVHQRFLLFYRDSSTSSFFLFLWTSNMNSPLRFLGLKFSVGPKMFWWVEVRKEVKKVALFSRDLRGYKLKDLPGDDMMAENPRFAWCLLAVDGISKRIFLFQRTSSNFGIKDKVVRKRFGGLEGGGCKIV